MLFVQLYATAQENITDSLSLQTVEVSTIKATEKNPFAKTNLSKADIKRINIGQDLPFIINHTPSVVVHSDAGTGIGYTGLRIRGTDATRINVTLNGIPYNDAESLGTFFVDMPDIAASASSIQIQRGVGTSANGAGSFGGSININTNETVLQKNLEITNNIGSYGTLRNTVLYNSGKLKKHFVVDARISNIVSDGYIDRASAKLNSYYASAAYFDEKNTLRFNIFTGNEKTYQAYYGLPSDSIKTNRTYNSAGTEQANTPYNNQIDKYTQTHYQLFYTHRYNKYLKSNVTLFTTRGKGYYEQYKASQSLGDYGLPALSANTDIVTQLWLDNYFYGSIFSLVYDKKQTQLIWGGGYNRYDGKHYGKIVWAKNAPIIPKQYKWYNTNALKTDFSTYLKWTQTLNKYWQTFVDIQVRQVNYNIDGFRNNPQLLANNSFVFINPKLGLTYTNQSLKMYASIGQANKEPNRDDFEGSKANKPVPERLIDVEVGLEVKEKTLQYGVNFYYMVYKNQLINTGKINDVGAYTRTNIANSYRAGLEVFVQQKVSEYLTISGNATLSENKVKNFTEYYDDYDNGGQIAKQYTETNLAYSPDIIANFTASIYPIKNASILLTSKYVGTQFLDNTNNPNRKLHAFYTQDARLAYAIPCKKIKEINLFVQAINLFSRLYEPNGYTFSYLLNDAVRTENYYFPMAPINFMMGINVRL